MLTLLAFLLDLASGQPILQPLLSFASLEIFGEDFASGLPILPALLVSLGFLGLFLRLHWQQMEI